MTTEFFMAMLLSTCTHQEKKVHVVNGMPVFYVPPELKEARAKLAAHLSKHVPAEPDTGAVQLITKWCFPNDGKHKNGEYKITKLHSDNLQKLLKEVMTDIHYWKDDTLVVSEIIEKFWNDPPGIYIRIEEL
ncbi:MAG: RusA family crossover junction endodeoxyribonuclease [Anaerotignum sp.]|nr:RusA family crossover junction endodeoxyribonuclease [Anaerotignum sp.]